MLIMIDILFETHLDNTLCLFLLAFSSMFCYLLELTQIKLTSTSIFTSSFISLEKRIKANKVLEENLFFFRLCDIKRWIKLILHKNLISLEEVKEDEKLSKLKNLRAS